MPTPTRANPSLREPPRLPVINIGSGKEITLAELANLVKSTIDYRGEIRWDASKPDGTMRKLTDVSRLHALGWHHTIEIEDGVRTLYHWYQQN